MNLSKATFLILLLGLILVLLIPKAIMDIAVLLVVFGLLGIWIKKVS